MRKAALLFILAVLAPSLLLAWFALRSIRNQELILHEQRDLLYEELAESLAKDVVEVINEQQQQFAVKVEMVRGNLTESEIEQRFDRYMERMMPIARTGFVVTLDGHMLSPPLLGEPGARKFRLAYERFLTSKETAQVYWEGPKGRVNLSKLDEPEKSSAKVAPQSARTEFREIIGDKTQGTVARFIQNELGLLFWYRPPQHSDMVYGIEVDLQRLATLLTNAVNISQKQAASEVCVALLDQNFRPVAKSRSSFTTKWREPFTAVEIGDLLPHWKVGIYLLEPAHLNRTAQSLRVTLGLLVGMSVLSILAGGWVIFRDLKREVEQAKLRTDFVSNVSHELKTPLTSIRMFSELLADGRVQEEQRAKSYLRIIISETARLTRLINNVLDFARMERGEKQYQFDQVELTALVRETVESYRPHLERSGFEVSLDDSKEPFTIEGDRDALSQVILNLLSNAEKYSGDRKEIHVSIEHANGRALLNVEDRGRGVPPGFEEKIFEQFVRAHDSLAEPVSGAGLGLTLARQIVESHRGRIWFERREGGGSRFVAELPLT